MIHEITLQGNYLINIYPVKTWLMKPQARINIPETFDSTMAVISLNLFALICSDPSPLNDKSARTVPAKCLTLHNSCQIPLLRDLMLQAYP